MKNVEKVCKIGFEKADADGSGDLNPEEWAAAKEMLAKMAENEEAAEKIRNTPFEEFDGDKDGKISWEEFWVAARRFLRKKFIDEMKRGR